jgi:type IV pilus assembly protein PilC
MGVTIPQLRLALFFDSLAIQLNVGRPIADSLLDAAHNSGDRELQQIFTAVAPKLRLGQSLSFCLRPYEERFPELVMCVLQVGEMSGGVAEASCRLADTYRQMVATQREISTNAFSPRKALSVICMLYTIVLIFDGLKSTAANIPPVAFAFIVGTKVGMLAAGIIIAAFIVRAILHQLYRWKQLRLIVDTLKLAWPGLGIITRNLAAARWARSFAVLWSAGVNISTALEASSKTALNAHYERELRAAAVQTRMGRPLSDCLARTKLLPPFLLGIIRSCEITGKMDDQLVRLAIEMEREALDRSIREMNRIVMTSVLFLMLLAAIVMLGQLAV